MFYLAHSLRVLPQKKCPMANKTENIISMFPSSGKTKKKEQFKENGKTNGNYTASMAFPFHSETVSMFLLAAFTTF